MRDEVYAFGIKGILSNGAHTPVFHIPGRDVITNTTLINIGNSNTHYRTPAFTN